MSARPFDAVLVVGLDDVSPSSASSRGQAHGLRARLLEHGIDVPVYFGKNDRPPLLPDVLHAMARNGVRRAIGLALAPHHSYSSCTRYRQDVLDARAEIVGSGLPDMSVIDVADWHIREKFLEVNARNVLGALGALPEALGPTARIVFTALSAPGTLTGAGPYWARLLESAGLVAERLGRSDWALVLESQRGRPNGGWLAHDVSRYLRDEWRKGLTAAVLCPIDPLCDYLEVLYDFEHDVAAACREIGLPIALAHTVHDDAMILDMMVDLVLRTWERYRDGLPLAVASSSPPVLIEGPTPLPAKAPRA